MKEAKETIGTANQQVEIGIVKKSLDEGKRARRSSWSKDKKFIFRQVPSEVLSKYVPKMTSLPDTVKSYFEDTFNNPEEQIDSIYYSNQIAMVGLSNVITSFSFSTVDAMAEDWVILD